MKLRIIRLIFVVIITSLLIAPPPLNYKIFITKACSATETTDLPEETVEAGAVVEAGADDGKLMLSPGTVTVIRPQEMKGEQKNLPELLKQVPGLHVMELKGRGAYTTASVRGSTSSQVAVYVDGILMNLGSESAVDLSTIPVENVEKIEASGMIVGKSPPASD